MFEGDTLPRGMVRGESMVCKGTEVKGREKKNKGEGNGFKEDLRDEVLVWCLVYE